MGFTDKTNKNVGLLVYFNIGYVNMMSGFILPSSYLQDPSDSSPASGL